MCKSDSKRNDWIRETNTYKTARCNPVTLSTCEKIILGTWSDSGNCVQIISSGIGSNGGCVRIRFGFGSGAGSDKLRLTRSCDSCVKFIGDFHASKTQKKKQN